MKYSFAACLFLGNALCSPVGTIRNKPIGDINPNCLNCFGGNCPQEVLDVLDNMSSLDALVEVFLLRTINSFVSGNTCLRIQLNNLRNSVLMPAAVFEAMMAFNQSTDDQKWTSTQDIFKSLMTPAEGEL